MKRLLLLIPLVFFSYFSFAQYSWQGVVIDSVDKSPLAFVTIIVNNNPFQGTRTDIDGKFTVTLPEKNGTITLSYVGYQNKTVELVASEKKNFITIGLSEKQFELGSVTIVAGENPANRIIKEVTKNADKNNPQKLSSYSYTSYDKFSFTGDATDEYRLKKSDSAYNKEFEFFKKYKMFIMETIVDKKYKFPGRTKEMVEAIKISGLKEPSFTLLMSQMQSTAFYDQFISVMQKDFLNPISKGSTEKYFFNIEDTTYSGKDTVFVISYKPAKGKTFDALKGLLYITTDGYAIEEVKASPADSIGILLYFNILQQYSKVDGHWFPTQLNTDLYYNDFLYRGLKMTMSGRSYITNIKINPDIPNSVFDGIVQEIDPRAGTRKEEYWGTHRHDTLSLSEQNTYIFIDSVGKKHMLDAKLKAIEALANGEFPYKFFNFALSRFLSLNKQEDLRLGLGGRTNERLSPYFSLGGFFGYGFKDDIWKYGGNLSLTLYRKNNLQLNFKYAKDYSEMGAVNFYKEGFWGSGLKARNYLIHNFDLIEEKKIAFAGRTFKNLNFELSGFERSKQAMYPYYFVTAENNEPTLKNHFTYTGAELGIRYCYNEKVIQIMNQNWFVSSRYPILWLNVGKGFKGVLNGEYDYLKLDFKMSYSFLVKSLGETFFQIQAGNVSAKLPINELYTGRGSYYFFGFYSFNSFETMRIGEFLSNRYAAVFLRQNFGSLLFRAKKFQPEVLFATNATIGTLNNPEQHLDIPFKTLNKGYLESGIIIENILTKKFMGVARFGIGAGAFYRYGPYMFPNPWDNITFKIDWTITN